MTCCRFVGMIRERTWGQQVLPKRPYCIPEDWSNRPKSWAYSWYYYFLIFNSSHSHNRDVWTKMELPHMFLFLPPKKQIAGLTDSLAHWLTDSLTHSLTPWSRVLLEMLLFISHPWSTTNLPERPLSSSFFPSYRIALRSILYCFGL
jgi:hypothetical protein